MRTLFNDRDRRALAERIQRLTPEASPRWGSLSAGRMLCHVADQLRLALGDLTASPASGPLTLPGLKQLAIYVIPWPKGVRTAPEMLTTRADVFADDRDQLLRLMDRFARRGTQASWHPHPLFGALSGKDWGVLAARHLDHHLRQFGV